MTEFIKLKFLFYFFLIFTFSVNTLTLALLRNQTVEAIITKKKIFESSKSVVYINLYCSILFRCNPTNKEVIKSSK